MFLGMAATGIGIALFSFAPKKDKMSKMMTRMMTEHLKAELEMDKEQTASFKDSQATFFKKFWELNDNKELGEYEKQRELLMLVIAQWDHVKTILNEDQLDRLDSLFASHHHRKHHYFKEKMAAHRKEIMPIVKAHREAFEELLSEKERETIISLRTEMASFKEEHRPPSPEKLKELMEDGKYDAYMGIVKGHEEFLNSVYQDMATKGQFTGHGGHCGPGAGCFGIDPSFKRSLMKQRAWAHFILMDIDEVRSTSGISVKIFPTPANEYQTIAIDLLRPEEVSVSLYNDQGMLITDVMSGKLSDGVNQIQVDLTEVEKEGVYYYLIETEDSEIKKRAIIKR